MKYLRGPAQIWLLLTGLAIILVDLIVFGSQGTSSQQTEIPHYMKVPQFLLGCAGGLLLLVSTVGFVMSKNHYRRLLLVAGIALAITLAHFIPVYSRTGSTDFGSCVIQGNIRNDIHRIIPEGVSEFNVSLSHLVSKDQATDCNPLVNIRLYLL